MADLRRSRLRAHHRHGGHRFRHYLNKINNLRLLKSKNPHKAPHKFFTRSLNSIVASVTRPADQGATCSIKIVPYPPLAKVYNHVIYWRERVNLTKRHAAYLDGEEPRAVAHWLEPEQREGTSVPPKPSPYSPRRADANPVASRTAPDIPEDRCS